MGCGKVVMTNSTTTCSTDVHCLDSTTQAKADSWIAATVILPIAPAYLVYEEFGKSNVLTLFDAQDATATQGTQGQLFHTDLSIRTKIATLRQNSLGDDPNTSQGPTEQTENGPRDMGYNYLVVHRSQLLKHIRAELQYCTIALRWGTLRASRTFSTVSNLLSAPRKSAHPPSL